MSLLDPREKTINIKVVYYGPGLGGKTTSLKGVHRFLDPENRVRMVSLDTDDDRTLFFDFVPIDLGLVGKYRVRIQGFTVPGQVKYNMTRRYVLTGADGVVFVADSDPARIEEDVESLINLGDNLKSHGLDVNTIPLVFQYNKRDLPSVLPVKVMEERLNFRGAPAFETVATTGKGVLEAFVAISRQVIRSVVEVYNLRHPEEPETALLQAAEERIRSLASRSVAPVCAADPAAAVPPQGQGPAAHARAAAPPPTAGAPLAMAAPEPAGTGWRLAPAQPREVPRPAAAPRREGATPAPLPAETAVVIPEERLTRRQRRGVLSSYLEIARSILQAPDAERPLLVAVQAGLNYLEAKGGSFLMLHPYRGILEERVVLGYHADPLLSLAPRSGERALLSRLGSLGDGIVVGPQSNADLLEEVRAHDPGLVSLMIAPVVARQATLGFLAYYFDTHEARRREREDLKYLVTLAMFAALALDRAGEAASRALFNIQDVIAGRRR